MNFNKRVQDVTEVFDSRWNVNHNNQECKEVLDSKKEHFNKIHQIQNREERRKKILWSHSVEGQVTRLKDQMNSASNVNRMRKMKDFKDNFR